MTNFIKIKEAVKRLSTEFNWFHSFVRELYFSSAHCFQRPAGDGTSPVGDVWSSTDLRMVVAAAGNPKIFGIDVIFFDVQSFSVNRLDELTFSCRFGIGELRVSFTSQAGDNGGCWVVAKDARVSFLGDEYVGPWLRLGNEVPRDEAIDAVTIDGCWRQCSYCSNAWAERPAVEYSRCTKCGRLTKLLASARE